MSGSIFSVLISKPSLSRSANPQTFAHQTFATNWLIFNSDSMATVRHCQRDSVPKSDIVAQGYDLSINRYKEVVHEEVDHRPPQAILDELESIEREITQGMKQLRGMLK